MTAQKEIGCQLQARAKGRYPAVLSPLNRILYHRNYKGLFIKPNADSPGILRVDYGIIVEG